MIDMDKLRIVNGEIIQGDNIICEVDTIIGLVKRGDVLYEVAGNEIYSVDVMGIYNNEYPDRELVIEVYHENMYRSNTRGQHHYGVTQIGHLYKNITKAKIELLKQIKEHFRDEKKKAQIIMDNLEKAQIEDIEMKFGSMQNMDNFIADNAEYFV